MPRRSSALRRLSFSLGLALLAFAVPTAGAPAGTGPAAPAPYFSGARDPAAAELAALLGFAPGERAATHGEIERCLDAWAKSSRARLFEHGKTWEGRTLYHLAISAPANLARLEEIREGWAKVADPRRSDAREAERLATELPAVAWLAFSIHGDEISGADAALVLADHLIAGRDPEVEALLDRLVVFIDPLQNPDGRDRYLARVRETRGATPVSDGQSMLQQGSWPWGRTNHYGFDLNRDWVFATQPETRGRIAALAPWHPLFFLDVHEMGLDSTFLFYPPRPPFNPFLPEPARRWWDRFGRDEAAAFDRQGWRYYTGEWADWWFPGYSDTYGTFRGAIGILHEQAGITAGSVRLESGQLLSYRESVAHQVTAAWANLATLGAHRVEIARDFARWRRRALAEDGPLAGRTLAVVPDGNASRLSRFAELVERLGGELARLDRATSLTARDPFGRSREVELPAGTLLVPGRQPEGHLLRATLDFDLPLPDEVLAKERAALVAGRDTLLYDVSGWSLPLLYGLDAYELDFDLSSRELSPGQAKRATAAAFGRGSAGPLGRSPAGEPVAWVIDGADDASVALAAKLLGDDLAVRLADEAFTLDGTSFARGSLVVTRDDNRARAGELAAHLRAAASALGVEPRAVSTGLGAGDLADLGGDHFLLLERPRVALAGYGHADVNDHGALWYALDHELGLPVSLLAGDGLDDADLRRYNVLVLAPGIPLDEGAAKAVKAWVEAGGTLVAVSQASARVASEKSQLSSARQLADVVADLASFRADLLSTWRDAPGLPPVAELWHDAVRRHAVDGTAEVPWEGVQGDVDMLDLDKEELERREAYAARFLPQGAILAGRVDTEHWLTVGAGAALPIFVAQGPVLLAKSPVEVPVRLGVARALPPPAREEGRDPATTAAQPRWRALGWSAVPGNAELDLRLSGLLWPEAAERLASSAYLTRERLGHGQVILFAGDPVYRGAALGTARLFANAVVYGPGCGARRVRLP